MSPEYLGKSIFGMILNIGTKLLFFIQYKPLPVINQEIKAMDLIISAKIRLILGLMLDTGQNPLRFRDFILNFLGIVFGRPVSLECQSVLILYLYCC